MHKLLVLVLVALFDHHYNTIKLPPVIYYHKVLMYVHFHCPFSAKAESFPFQ